MPSRLDQLWLTKMLARKDQWATSYRIIAFNRNGDHKFAVTVPVRRTNYSRLTEEAQCVYEPENGVQLAGLSEALRDGALSFGSEWSYEINRHIPFSEFREFGHVTVEYYKSRRLSPYEEQDKVMET